MPFFVSLKAPVLAKFFLNQLSGIRQCDNISNTIKVSQIACNAFLGFRFCTCKIN